MKRLMMILLIFSLHSFVYAQESTQLTSFIGRVNVTHVSLVRDGANNLSLRINGIPESCGPVVVEQFLQDYTGYAADGTAETQGKVIEVLLHTAPLKPGETCNFFAPYEQQVDLLGAYDFDEDIVLIVNDFAAWIYLAQPGAMILDLPMQVVDVGEEDLIRWINNRIAADSVDWDTSGETIRAEIQGIYPPGCGTTPMSRIGRERLDGETHRIDLFWLQPADMMCEIPFEDFSVQVDTGLAKESPALIETGSQLFKYDPDSAGDLFSLVLRRWLQIETVDIREDGGAFAVEIQGNQNGSCNTPLLEVVASGPNHSMISLFDLPGMVTACTSDIRGYHNTFTVDSIPVIINGRVYDDSGTSDDMQPEQGVTMQVDTVIENVEVQVLESFPMQLHLTISGYQPDGCQFPVQLEQRVDGNNVNLHIFREVPADTMCPMNIVSYEDTIVISDGFTGGTVTIQVNDYTATVDL